MISQDILLLLFAFIALIGPVVFLIFLNCIPRWLRMGIYLVCVAMHLFAALVLSSLSGIQRNCASGERAQRFFESLQQQLAAGTVHQDFLTLPSYALSVVLTLLAVAAVIAGAVFAWRKIRWYSWFVLIFAFIMTQFAFSVCARAKDRESIEYHNETRRLVYGLIEQKRTEGVTDRQMAETIAENLKDFCYSYENRRSEIESEKRIEDALKKLRRVEIQPIVKKTAEIIYLETGFSPPTEKIVIDFENDKISYEFSYTSGKIGKEGYKKRELSPKAVKDFKARLAGFSAARWKDRYFAPQVCDGTQWQLEIIFSDGSSRKIAGSNAWPKDFDLLCIGDIRKRMREEAKP